MLFRECATGLEVRAVQMKSAGVVGVEDATVSHDPGDFIVSIEGKLQVIKEKAFKSRFMQVFDKPLWLPEATFPEKISEMKPLEITKKEEKPEVISLEDKRLDKQLTESIEVAAKKKASKKKEE